VKKCHGGTGLSFERGAGGDKLWGTESNEARGEPNRVRRTKTKIAKNPANHQKSKHEGTPAWCTYITGAETNGVRGCPLQTRWAGGKGPVGVTPRREEQVRWSPHLKLRENGHRDESGVGTPPPRIVSVF